MHLKTLLIRCFNIVTRLRFCLPRPGLPLSLRFTAASISVGGFLSNHQWMRLTEKKKWKNVSVEWAATKRSPPYCLVLQVGLSEFESEITEYKYTLNHLSLGTMLLQPVRCKKKVCLCAFQARCLFIYVFCRRFSLVSSSRESRSFLSLNAQAEDD